MSITSYPIPEHVIPGKRLGRHVHHDPRSLAYTITPRLVARSVLWKLHAPVLDQGNLGSCTGNSAVQALNCSPFFETMAPGFDGNEALAVHVYAVATTLDSQPGSYPPDDTGSDGLSAAKATQKLGYIVGETHALTLNAVIAGLQTGPMPTGLNWYDSFDTPGSNGVIGISSDAQVRGGHEPLLVGVDVEMQTLRILNSWSDTWGDHGYATIGYGDYTRLLAEDGDATLYAPVNGPAPVPTPTPTPPATGRTVTFSAPQYATLTQWAAGHHIGVNKHAADAFNAATQ